MASARRLFVTVVALALSVLCAWPSRAHAQAYTESTLYVPQTVAEGYVLYAPLMQASDGNLYGVAAYNVDTSSSIFNVSLAGESALVYNFPLSGDSDFAQSGLTEGSDGNLYGVLTNGGTSSSIQPYGLIYQISLPSGTESNFYPFCTSKETNGDCAGPAFPDGAMIVGSDGNLYGTTIQGGSTASGNFDGTIFKITPSGALTILYSFCSQGGTACTDGMNPEAALIQGLDGNFYGTTFQGGESCPALNPSGTTPGCGTVFKITPQGVYTVIHAFTGANDGAYPMSQLVQAADGNFYGTEYFGPNATWEGGCGADGDCPAEVYRVTPAGEVTPVYTLSPIPPSIGEIDDGLYVGSDGNLYGTDSQGGVDGGGSIYRISLDGIVNVLYSFPDNPTDADPAPYGSVPLSRPMQGSDGNFYGTAAFGGPIAGSNTGTVWKLAVSPPLPAPVILTLSQQNIQPNQSVTLNWSVANAYSTTMQQCYAFIQGSPTGAGAWTGLQTGTFDATQNPPYSGSATITPTADGVYTYALTCGGMESAFATLIVGAPPTLSVTTESLPAGQAGTAYAQTLQASGGVAPYTWSIGSGALPTGLSLAPGTGVISGTPTAPGTASFTVQVKDAESTPQSATQNLTITISPVPLAVSTTQLPSGSEGVAYSQTLVATGGITPYSWSITSGTLPTGLSLSSSSGTISGTPTSPATFVFTVQVKDSESTPQTATAGLNIVVNASAVTITTSSLPGATVGAAYSQTLEASGGVGPYAWSVVSGALPAGLSLATSTGVISGTPIAAGTASFSVQVKDSESTPQSVIATFSITVNLPPAAATPIFSPSAGTYTSAQKVTIGDATSGATIYYTTNGTTPTTSSTEYIGPVTVGSTETIEAIATASGYSTSAVASATYTINLPEAATPTFSPAAGTYTSAQTVTIGDSTPNATIYYTTNGATPTTSSAVYSGPITVSSSETIEAIAAASGYTTSAVATAAYTITSPGFSLTASPDSVSVIQGNSATSTITVTDVGGFSGNVALSSSGLPSGVTAAFAAGSAAGTQVATFSANASAAVTSNPVTVTIGGTSSGTLSATTSIALTIAEPPFTAGPDGTTTMTVSQGATTENTGTISVVGTNGFSGIVNLACSVTTSLTDVSDMPTCSLNPTSVTISGITAQTSTLTVTTTAASSAANQMRNPFWPVAGGDTLALALLFIRQRRRSRWQARLGLLILFISAGLVACGGGSSGGGGGGGGGSPGTTAGGYTITVTGTSGSVSATVGSIALTVQ